MRAREKRLCLVLILAAMAFQGVGCSNLRLNFGDSWDFGEREEWYRARGYDSEAARKAASEDSMFEWFESR